VRATHVDFTRRFSPVLATLLAALPACGGAIDAPAVAPAPTAAVAPPPPPAEHIALDVFLDGAPAGNESWSVTKERDGTTDIAFDAALEEKGAKLKGTGSLTLGTDLTTHGGTLTLDTPEGSVHVNIKDTAGVMSLTLSRGTESREIKAERASNVFLPQPFFVGFARICPILDGGTLPLVEFPGSPIAVIDHQALTGDATGVTMYTLERGELGRTVLACEKGDLIAALDPWNGQAAARSGRKAVLDALVHATTRQKPKTPDGIVDEEMTIAVPAFGKDAEAKLGCSFMRPVAPSAKPSAKSRRYPAVVFLSGSGPQDRDEDTIGPGGVKLSIFKTMAIALAERGIASVRCDDRGTAQSTGAFEQATLGTFVHDAEVVVKALRLRPDVDPARVGLIGHSEGGVVAPVVAHADTRLKGILLMAAPGRPIPDIAVTQQERMLEQAGLPKDQIKRQLDAQAEVLNAIRKGDPLPATVPPSERAHIESQRAWLKSHFDHDPQLALRQMPAMSVLVVQGGRDLQVPPDDAELVRKGLASGKNPKAKVIVYPTLSHLFAESHSGSVTEYSDPHAKIDPTFLGDVTSFFAQAFGVKGK
jgi:pimeloyl-ACP methyl ester carboxylesterase